MTSRTCSSSRKVDRDAGAVCCYRAERRRSVVDSLERRSLSWAINSVYSLRCSYVMFGICSSLANPLMEAMGVLNSWLMLDIKSFCSQEVCDKAEVIWLKANTSSSSSSVVCSFGSYTSKLPAATLWVAFVSRVMGLAIRHEASEDINTNTATKEEAANRTRRNAIKRTRKLPEGEILYT